MPLTTSPLASVNDGYGPSKPDLTEAEQILTNYFFAKGNLAEIKADCLAKTNQKNSRITIVNNTEGLVSIYELEAYFQANKQYDEALSNQEGAEKKFNELKEKVLDLLKQFPQKLFKFRVPNGKIQFNAEQTDFYSARFIGDDIEIAKL